MAGAAAGWAMVMASRYLQLCTSRFFTAVLLVNTTVYKKKLSITHNLNCVRLGGAEWSWWSPLALICALGFLNSTVLSNWLCFHMDVSDHGITQQKTALSVNSITTVFG